MQLQFNSIFYHNLLFIPMLLSAIYKDMFYLNSNVNNYSEHITPNRVYSVPSAVVSIHTSFSSDTSTNRFFPSIWIPTCPLKDSSFRRVLISPTVF